MATSNQAQDVVWCKYCQHYAAEFHCRNCGDDLCQTCTDSRKGHQHFSDHIIVPYLERETAGIRCRFHPTRFYGQGCETCGIRICPECKLKDHFKHISTDITTVYKKAKAKLQKGLTAMQTKERYLKECMSNGEGFRRSQDFKHVKKCLQDRAKEMKTFIDYFLSKTIQRIEKHENNYQRCVETYMGELAKIIGGTRKTIESDLKNLDLIDLTFSLNENPDWNYLLQPHEIQGLKIVHFEPKVFDSSEIECLFGTLSFEGTNLGKIFENTKKRRPKTAVPKLRVSEPWLKANSPTNHQEVSKTEREIRKRHNSASFQSTENTIRHEMGILEIPLLLKEFKSSNNFLYHITYDTQLSRLFISGFGPKIYTYNNDFGICNIYSKYKTFIVENEPQGLAIGYKNRLVYSDSQNGVIEIEQNITNEKGKEMPIKLGTNARILFNKEGYNFWGIHYTSSQEYLVCTIPYNREHLNASVIRIGNDGRLEHEYTNNKRGEPLFFQPLNVCENRLNQNICVSDMDSKVVVLTSSGIVRFIYRGVQPTLSRSPFNPRGIACDERGNILVADLNNHVVHLLKGDGVFVTHVLSSISPISQPWGICVDSQNKIWVVERNMNSGEVQTYAKVKVFQIYKT